jgi:hypothetical protein
MEQFIRESVETPTNADVHASEADPAEIAVFIMETEAGHEPPLPRIIVLSDDEDEDEAHEPHDEWRRQLISALQDSDRQAPSPAPPLPEPETQPLLPYIEPRPRLSSRTLVPGRPARIVTSAPVERAPRHRVGLSILGVSATTALLCATLPHTTDMADHAASTASATVVAASGLDKPSADESGTFKPVMFNSPVLVREGISLAPKISASVLPVIETVRTVPVPLGRLAEVSPVSAPLMARTDQRPEPAAAPAPAPTPPPLDRDRLAALTADPPTAPPRAPVLEAPAVEQTPAPPAAATPERRATAEPPTAPIRTRHTPQIATSYERVASQTPKRARKQPSRSDTRTASRTKPAQQWETRRQGLRTAPPPAEEPSTMSKLVKSLWPFSSKESNTDTTTKSRLGVKPSDTAAQTKAKPSDAPTPSKSKDSFWWHEREAQR